ncbi:hypothetical protein TBR22_A34830 [Luteitalea sp. TBR-22]|uniref:hypothetical protein n=1 Tax=Luteitalea sp. TBR-22 TaxID=2802971 RepID=UPI001AF1AB5B|nr:hypothetical protein [Luteitalea sp. TBR-22]BCS34254.1 hypothetical protein TBR22_A34830 [Luteitalea sp. TBR-22]
MTHAFARPRTLAFVGLLPVLAVGPAAAQGQRHPPKATLGAAARQALVLAGEPIVDSNSPVVWDAVDGESRVFVMTSFAGAARVSSGQRIGEIVVGEAAQWDVWPDGGAWMEAVVKADDGTWYGYYHNEVATACPADGRVQPRIGAARSTDQGRSWTNLGIVLESPAADCGSTNQYFTGGVGDFSVLLSPDRADVYLLYSQYTPGLEGQGVALARLPWADRDAPTGRPSIWDGHVWRPVESTWTDEGDFAGYAYPTGISIFEATDSLHDGDSADVFWGPSVHWNAHLGQYVMLLNRARTPGFGQEGIYVAFSPTLAEPEKWTAPARILAGGEWYPQVVGLEPGVGTDKEAGEVVRFFMAGVSEYVLTFSND